MQIKKIVFVLFCGICFPLSAQIPVPALPQNRAVVLMNGIAHVGNGEVIEKSVIVFEHGKITSIGYAGRVQVDTAGKEVMELSGMHVYPGFIAPTTNLGLTEIESVRATRDEKETGSLNPNIRAIVAYNAESKVIPTVRSNGVLLAQIAPHGGLISGQSSVTALDAWNWEDAAYKTDEGIFLNWPKEYVNQGWWAEQEIDRKEETAKETARLRMFFSEAKAYSKEGYHAVRNLRFEAMRGLFDGTKKLYVRADLVKEIQGAIYFCKEFGVKMVLVGGRDAWMVTNLLLENNVPVIVGQPHALPSREDEPADQSYRLPFLLQNAGVLYCISIDGFWQQRNLAFHAGTGAAYGLTKEQALRAITSNTAQILGIEKTTGTLETGKDATLIVSTGDILDMRTSNVVCAFIRGKRLDLTNHQKELYDKYSRKLGVKQ